MANEYVPNNPIYQIANDWLYREVLRPHSDQVTDSIHQHLDDAIEGNILEHPAQQVSDITFQLQAQLAQN